MGSSGWCGIAQCDGNCEHRHVQISVFHWVRFHGHGACWFSRQEGTWGFRCIGGVLGLGTPRRSSKPPKGGFALVARVGFCHKAERASAGALAKRASAPGHGPSGRRRCTIIRMGVGGFYESVAKSYIAVLSVPSSRRPRKHAPVKVWERLMHFVMH